MTERKYAQADYLNHVHQTRDEFISWNETLGHFKNPALREAYKAGFENGARQAVNLLKLHGGFKFAPLKGKK